jgi:hypothetical protein
MRRRGVQGAYKITTIRCKNLTVRLRSARRDATISLIFAVRTARCEGRPWYLQRAERAAASGAVLAARRIIFFIKSDYYGKFWGLGLRSC